MKRRQLLWAITGVSAVLGFMLTVQISSRPTANRAIPNDYVDLRTQLAEQAQEHQILEHDISKTAAQLAEFKVASGSKANTQKALEADAQTLAEEAGTAPMSGPGMTMTIQDDPNLPYVAQYADTFSKESDQWISLIVNYLFSNGATAISINGQRLVTTSSIRLVIGMDGMGGLQVNTHPVAMPYVITAIGNINDMQSVLTVYKIQDYLNLMGEDFIIHTYPEKNGVTVPAYTGPLPGTWAKEVKSP